MKPTGEQLIHKSRDDFGELHIKDDGLIRTLYFGNEKKQTCTFLPDPSVLILQYAQAMTSLLLFEQAPEKILLVGLGGGSMLHFLRKACPESQIDVIELRQSVIDISHDYFSVPRDDKQINIIQADAKHYVEKLSQESNGTYSWILVDAFDAWGPAQLNKDDKFIQSCQSLLKSKGIMCFNLWNRKEDYFHHISRQLSDLFSGNTLELRLGKKNSNVIVFGFLQAQPLKRSRQQEVIACQLSEAYGIDYLRFYKLIEVQNYSLLNRLRKQLTVQF